MRSSRPIERSFTPELFEHIIDLYHATLRVNSGSILRDGLKMGTRAGSTPAVFPHHDPRGRNQGVQRARWSEPE
eukprot:9017088-Lingulodinium_polyedra.AAC.1